MTEELRRVKVWSASVRLLHWLLALTVCLLIATGWLFRQAGVADLLFIGRLWDLHMMAAHVFVLALVARILLLFGKESAGWRDFLISRTQRPALRDMLRFYLSLGRSPMPSYYAHNPFWGPIYLLMFLVLLAQVVSGMLIRYQPGGILRWIPELKHLHDVGYAIIATFVPFHILTAFLHDWKGKGAEVSAMISGYKLFVVQRPEQPGTVQTVSIDDIGGRRDG